jgi:hypothetical protein
VALDKLDDRFFESEVEPADDAADGEGLSLCRVDSAVRRG